MGGGRNEGERRGRGLPSVPTVPNLSLHHYIQCSDSIFASAIEGFTTEAIYFWVGERCVLTDILCDALYLFTQ